MSKKFEDKLKNAKDILDSLVSEDVDLDDALKLYKDGMKNLNEAQSMLDNAKGEFEELVQENERSEVNPKS